jgi:hypothetical protein
LIDPADVLYFYVDHGALRDRMVVEGFETFSAFSR